MNQYFRLLIVVGSILLAMARLTETLGTAKTPKYSYNYTPPRIESPYPHYQAQRFAGSDQNPNLYSSLAQQQQVQAQKPLPSLQFQAEYDYDPILMKISSFGDLAIADARSEAANLKKKALIEAGDADITRELAGDDQNTIDAAAANPFSTKKLLEKDYADRGVQLDQALNQQNLFYSGKRADDLTELERGRTKAYTDWSQVLRDLLGNVDSGLLVAEEKDRTRRLAEEAATAANAAASRSSSGGSRSSGGSTGSTESQNTEPTGTYPDGTPRYDVGGEYVRDYVDIPPPPTAQTAAERLRRGREQRLFESLGLA
jgi:hypothetical protein